MKIIEIKKENEAIFETKNDYKYIIDKIDSENKKKNIILLTLNKSEVNKSSQLYISQNWDNLLLNSLKMNYSESYIETIEEQIFLCNESHEISKTNFNKVNAGTSKIVLYVNKMGQICMKLFDDENKKLNKKFNENEFLILLEKTIIIIKSENDFEDRIKNKFNNIFNYKVENQKLLSKNLVKVSNDFDNMENKIWILGNGFDLFFNRKTNYSDFYKWLIEGNNKMTVSTNFLLDYIFCNSLNGFESWVSIEEALDSLISLKTNEIELLINKWKSKCKFSIENVKLRDKIHLDHNVIINEEYFKLDKKNLFINPDSELNLKVINVKITDFILLNLKEITLYWRVYLNTVVEVNEQRVLNSNKIVASSKSKSFDCWNPTDVSDIYFKEEESEVNITKNDYIYSFNYTTIPFQIVQEWNSNYWNPLGTFFNNESVEQSHMNWQKLEKINITNSYFDKITYLHGYINPIFGVSTNVNNTNFNFSKQVQYLHEDNFNSKYIAKSKLKEQNSTYSINIWGHSLSKLDYSTFFHLFDEIKVFDFGNKLVQKRHINVYFSVEYLLKGLEKDSIEYKIIVSSERRKIIENLIKLLYSYFEYKEKTQKNLEIIKIISNFEKFINIWQVEYKY